ncbi:hypothetical protein ABID82_002245 [Methylobacterium sp. PvP062]|uniref:Uncharacterized protein n=1 Tax=Methylobacterium radiotolerans TaxID=31998 RepID=A0ABV2NNC7_9HYPH|nr:MULTISPECIES: hypothetical protein [unclassified Methylobacterium]MBP2495423.1 hypothetical protein [Methylobacterium sp. PvP105]MBP2504706.1 hypothetical protein [Methylobacterium sp. PvP109]MCX7335719.1 hypothetical protein [Hyphomicrobiales bacterium]
MTAPAQTDARAEAKERFCNAALWWMADQSCSEALAELEDAHEAYCAALRDSLAETLRAAREAA